MRAMTMILLATLAAPGLAQAINCSQIPVQQPLQSTVIAPVSGELDVVFNLLGTPGGVLSEAYGESQSVDQVLLRIHAESCSNVAIATPAPGVVDPNDPANYKPKTEFDNTPWRFNMTQNGKQMTADEFTAWMEARGVRVARGRAPAPAATTDTAVADPATVDATVSPETTPTPAEASQGGTDQSEAPPQPL